MAWKTGEACGFTLTLSVASRCAKYRAVMTVTRLALEAWWPPTLTPSPVSRSWLAASMMRVASHRTRCWMVSRTSVSASVPAIAAVAGGTSRAAGDGRHAHRHQRPAGAARPAQRREQRLELVGRVDLHPVHLQLVLAVVPDQHVADRQRGVRRR